MPCLKIELRADGHARVTSGKRVEQNSRHNAERLFNALKRVYIKSRGLCIKLAGRRHVRNGLERQLFGGFCALAHGGGIVQNANAVEIVEKAVCLRVYKRQVFVGKADVGAASYKRLLLHKSLHGVHIRIISCRKHLQLLFTRTVNKAAPVVGQHHLVGGRYEHGLVDSFRKALCRGVEIPHAVYFVAEKLYAKGRVRGRKYIHNASAHRKLSGALYKLHAGVPSGAEHGAQPVKINGARGVDV